MSTPSATALLFLTGRWLRSRGARRSSVILVLAFTVLALVFVCVSAFTLSADQEADASFGAYQQQTYTEMYVGDLAPDFVTRTGAALAAGAPGSHLFIDSTDLPPDSFAKTYVQAPLTLVQYVEDPGLQQAFPGRYTLDRGSWPRSPGDVVVSQHLLDALPDPASFTVLSGRATFHVVGVVTDAYAQDGDLIAGGAGTWESIPTPPPGHASQPVEGSLGILLGAGTSPADVARVLGATLPPRDREGLVTSLKGNRSTRSEVAGEPVATFGSDQLVVSYLPLLLVVLLVSGLVVGRSRGPHRADADRLVALGVRRTVVVLTQAVALCVVAAGSILAGLALGWLLALALRATVLPVFDDQPLSPIPGLEAPAVGIALSSLVLVTVGTAWPGRHAVRARWSAVSRGLARIPAGLIRRVVVVGLVVGALKVGGGVTSVVASYLAVAAVVLAAPELLRLVVWILPRGNPRSFVVGRLMRVDPGRQAAAVVVVGCCLAVPILVGTQLASQRANDASFSYSHVPPHQIWIESDGGIGDVPAVARIVSRVPGVGRPVALRDLAYPSGPPGPKATDAVFSHQPLSGNLDVMVVDSANQARRIFGDALPGNAETVLEAGGVLDFTGTTGDQSFVVESEKGTRLRATPTLPTVKVRVDRVFRASFGGAVLRGTAQELRLPINPPRRFIFPDVSPEVTGNAVQAAVDAGYDSDFVQYAVTPPPPDLPTYAYVFLAGLVLGGFAVLLVVVRGQARRLRAYSARLVAVGLGPRWILSLLGIQAAAMVGVGLVAGVAGGVLGIRVTSDHYAVTDVPVLPIVVACVATVVAAGLATALAVRALTATEHPEVT